MTTQLTSNTQLATLPAAGLHEYLRAALGEVRAIEAKDGEKASITNQAVKAFGKFRVQLTLGLVMTIFLAAAVALLGVFLQLPLDDLFFLELPPMIVGGVLLLLFAAKNAKKRKAARQNLTMLDAELAQLLQSVTALPYLPADYCSSVALGYMVDLLEKGRAATWKECADKFEEQQHRWTLEANSAEAARYASEAASAARWAAAGAWLR